MIPRILYAFRVLCVIKWMEKIYLKNTYTAFHELDALSFLFD